jgi:hypothetical protein
VKAVEELTLIFMDPFHLDVKERVGVDVDFVFSLQVCRELQLVFLQAGKVKDSPRGFDFKKSYSLVAFLSLKPRKADGRRLTCCLPPPLHQDRHC